MGKSGAANLSKGTKTKITRRYNNKKSPSEIAKELGIEESTVIDYLESKGKRPKGSKSKKTGGKKDSKVKTKKIPGFKRVVEGPKKVELTCPNGEKAKVKKEASGKVLVTCGVPT